jgi:thiol-disulfide isomerase/thioredoxin
MKTSITVILLLVILWPSLCFSQRNFPEDYRITGPELGADFPSAYFKDLNDSIIDFSIFSNKVVYVNFWFVGCKGCKQEEEYIKKLVLSLKETDSVAFVAFVPNRHERIQKYLRSNYTFSEFHVFPLNNFKEIERIFGVRTYPTHLIIKDGKVVENFTRPILSSTTKWLITRIKELNSN